MGRPEPEYRGAVGLNPGFGCSVKLPYLYDWLVRSGVADVDGDN